MSDTAGEHAKEEFKPTKALVGAGIGVIVTGLGALAVAATDNVITPQEWITVTIAVLTAAGGIFGGVYGTTNNPK